MARERGSGEIRKIAGDGRGNPDRDVRSTPTWRPGIARVPRGIGRQRRYLGLARTHLQQLLTATAMNLVRVMAWLWGEPLSERRRKLGHFAQLAPHPLSRQTVRC
jgi:hypothetical protein